MIVYNLFYKNNFIATFSSVDSAKLFVNTLCQVQGVAEPYWIKSEITGMIESRDKTGKINPSYEIRETKVI